MIERPGRGADARGPRTTAEWCTLAGSCLVLAVVLALIGGQLLSTREPASPVATVEAQHVEDGLHHVDVRIANHGDETAANVQITAELTIGDEVTSADQTIDFLAGGEEEDLVFVFEDDPADGDLSVVVSSFGIP